MAGREKITTVVVEHSGMNKLMVGLILAAVIAWIVFVAKASNRDVLGDNQIDPSGNTHTHTEDQTRGEANLNTATVCFQAVIATTAVYFVLNHYMK